MTVSKAQLLTARNSGCERSLLAESSIFDIEGYIARAGWQAEFDPIGHYLEAGWRLGLEPNDRFPGTLLHPYFMTLGEFGPPAVTWLVLRSAGWKIPASREELGHLVHVVRNSGLFSDSYYQTQLGPNAAGLDPVVHYVTVGELLGLRPSLEFDPKYYAARNPDVVAAGMNCLVHYAESGRAENRMPKPEDLRQPGNAAFDPTKENILIVVHEASRTGAPILGWNMARYFAVRYNIFTICLGEGDLEPQFLDVSVEMLGPFPGHRRNVIDLAFSLDNLLGERTYKFAIVNSAESRMVLDQLAQRFVPSLFLVHEFASYVNPVSSLRSALDSSAEVVFSAPMVAKAAQEAHPYLAARTIHILPQGVTQLPPRNRDFSDKDALSSLQTLAARREKEGTFIVLGVGSVHLRKGVDLFLSAAASVARRQPQRPIHFLWVGDGFRPTEDMHYSVYLQEQIDRSGLAASVTFLGILSDVQPAYQIADAYFLSSRLDPLPNSAIDAAVSGIPVICFRNASGIADLLLSNPETALGVVGHLDSEAAASLLLNLAADSALYKRIAEATRQLARATFDLDAYCSKLDELGRSTSCRMKQRALDAETLLADPTFDQDMFLLPFNGTETRKATISRYLALAASRGWQSLPQTDPYLRRPAAGFNPRIYASAHADRLRAGADPLADFIRCGSPKGPWQATVLRPDDPVQPVIAAGKWRVALHAHFFYPELCRDFLAHLSPNLCECDLLITTDDSAKAAHIRRVLSEYSQGTVEVRVVPNRGRDLGPLLTEFAHDLDGYDLIGHVHGKRSQYAKGQLAGSKWGEQWREFQWQNLLGSLRPMMDRIVAAFEQDEDLGLVFPSDPNLVGWDANRDCAQEYAAKLGWSGSLPEHFDFPLGNMFWIRRPALQPLLGLHLQWDDYPEEPVAYDGTILHALERLLPFACKVAGYGFAVTHVPGVTWSPAAD